MNRTPVVLIHGAWLHRSSWDSWAALLTDQGFEVSAPGWPAEPVTVGEARRESGWLRGLGLDALTDHYERIVRSFDHPPVLIGHSVGGLIAQHLIGTNLGRAAVAIAPLPLDDLPLNDLPPTYSKTGLDALSGDEELGEDGLVPLPDHQFRQVFASAVSAEESALIFERYAVSSPRRLITDLRGRNAARATADIGNTVRGPLLLISGQEDRIVADSVTRAVYKLYGDSVAVSNLKQFADRGHSLVVDSGWHAVADYVLCWLADHGIRPELPAD
ncbi:alpha/beta hydrolase [Kribbella sp. VKM Ac-2566]|uniref:alpha/beta hydrolase n=1 Tax=Kribbella sp. VKM Ac-2566 TaxID=2512218 RepID=UPI0010631101|nr:alpha/beta fold hydrolase [Kribbella sp. VKM Ac-2566]TDW98561.1 alpha-beta hydrolase superfamily lysophospholipase [Kribbella sp. VKM Ac-2566]